MTWYERARLRLRWRLQMLRMGLTMPIIAGGDDGEGGSGDEGESGQKAEPEAKPPWGSEENFDAERAWKLLQATRGDAAKAKAEREKLAAQLKEHEDSQKTEQQKLTEQSAADKKAASEATQEAARLRVALRKGLTETQAKRLVGDNEEELEKDADELLASFRSDDDQGQASTRQQPRERLRPGAAPSAEPEETDPAKLAAQVPRMY